MTKLQKNEDLRETLFNRVSLLLKMFDELLELRARVWVAEFAAQNQTSVPRLRRPACFRRAVSTH